MECVSQRNLPAAGFDQASLSLDLADQSSFWEHWGFEPWQRGPFVGVARQQRFVKSGLLGPVAEYAAWEAIVWQGGGESARRELWRALTPLPNIMTQRFLFVLEETWAERKIRSFGLGFRGYAEFYSYWPGGAANPKARDLTGLVDLALQVAEKRRRPGL